MQRFKKGDYVHIVKDLGMFRSDCDAIVIGSYNDKYGGGNIKEYTIHIKDIGKTSWYKEKQLELIEANRIDLLKIWEDKEKKEIKQCSDLDWIFKKGKQVLENCHEATASALGKCAGINNMWGLRGEGYIFYQNTIFILSVAEPFLKKGDKKGWLKFCEEEGLKELIIKQ